MVLCYRRPWEEGWCSATDVPGRDSALHNKQSAVPCYRRPRKRFGTSREGYAATDDPGEKFGTPQQRESGALLQTSQ